MSHNVRIFSKIFFSVFCLLVNRDGGFVVRDSKHGGQDSPYTLTVHNNNKVFNINIRIRPDGKIALGKEKLDEKVIIICLLKAL